MSKLNKNTGDVTLTKEDRLKMMVQIERLQNMLETVMEIHDLYLSDINNLEGLRWELHRMCHLACNPDSEKRYAVPYVLEEDKNE